MLFAILVPTEAARLIQVDSALALDDEIDTAGERSDIALC